MSPATIILDPHPTAVRKARAFVAQHCRAWVDLGDTYDTALLLTSELVTNAFLHGRSQTRVAVTTTATSVHVEVSDDNSRHPAPACADPEALDGRGIAIVGLLATAWGVRDEPLGKTVWFRLDT